MYGIHKLMADNVTTWRCTVLWVISYAFVVILIFFKNFTKNFQEHNQSQTVWIQIRPDILLGLIWIQTVYKDYQQMAKIAASKKRGKLSLMLSRTEK